MIMSWLGTVQPHRGGERVERRVRLPHRAVASRVRADDHRSGRVTEEPAAAAGQHLTDTGLFPPAVVDLAADVGPVLGNLEPGPERRVSKVRDDRSDPAGDLVEALLGQVRDGGLLVLRNFGQGDDNVTVVRVPNLAHTRM